MKKNTTSKPNLLVQLTNRKMEVQNSGSAAETFGKFQPRKSRNENRSSVGPSWGPRKGN